VRKYNENLPDIYLYTITFRPALGSTQVKVKVKFTLEEATKAHRGSRGIDILFL